MCFLACLPLSSTCSSSSPLCFLTPLLLIPCCLQSQLLLSCPFHSSFLKHCTLCWDTLSLLFAQFHFICVCLPQHRCLTVLCLLLCFYYLRLWTFTNKGIVLVPTYLLIYFSSSHLFNEMINRLIKFYCLSLELYL